MRAAEQAAFASGVQVEALMNKAGVGIAQAVTKFFQEPGRCIVFAGKGHNAGDALFAAQCLERRGWKIEVRLAFKEADCSDLTRKKLGDLCRRAAGILGAALSKTADTDLVAKLIELSPDATDEKVTTQNSTAAEACSDVAAPLVILDGLLGVGAKPPLREPIRAACRAINQLRTTKDAYVFAVDLPTGLDTDSGNEDRDCVVADFTVTIGYAKPGLVADSALNYVGRIEVVLFMVRRPPRTKPKEIIASPTAFRALLPSRKYNSYKN